MIYLRKHPGRSLEIHLVDKAPTDKFNYDNFGLGDDTSEPSNERYYRNANNLPWALEITDSWQWPSERSPLIMAYPAFQTFVESDGEQQSNWFEPQLAIDNYLF
ncbi:LruC domain-containing protein [Psychromonas sp. KJ10-10]|uniref:LruC domain-containing protein n=1 Tax=Psychromonas sp. KJ10-10 TaxID=3391823 RepID=UPI0039B5171B